MTAKSSQIFGGKFGLFVFAIVIADIDARQNYLFVAVFYQIVNLFNDFPDRLML